MQKKILHKGLLCGIFISFLLATLDVHASIENLSLSGDFRFRLEQDWDSQQANGIERDDRFRARIRFRVNAEYAFTDSFKTVTRMRLGDNNSQQSPHYTLYDFSGNAKGDLDLGFDKWYLQYSDIHHHLKTNITLGKNSLNIWKQNELFWDDDATVAGAGLSVTKILASGTVSANTGYFLLPIGLDAYSGDLNFLQLVYETSIYKNKFAFATGIFNFDADPPDPDASRLLINNGVLDYQIWTVNSQYSFATIPVTLEFDIMKNILNYSTSELALAKDDEDYGIVAAIKYNRLFGKENIAFKYSFARIGALSVNSSFAQDDWLRWGSAIETRATDYSGHELKLTYKLKKYGNLNMRLFIVNAISTNEDGERLRADWNIKF